MIDYDVLAKSVGHYEWHGYQRIESPWLVTPRISAITKPENATDYLVRKSGSSEEKSFVASGEQSLLYLINKGHLPSAGKYQTITPCMRNEPFDELHWKYFMKNELIVYDEYGFKNWEEELGMVMDHAKAFFSQFLVDKQLLGVIETGPASYDIVVDGVEVGSYGYRECEFCGWVYGTGVAEPRFSNKLLEIRRAYVGLSRSEDREGDPRVAD